MRRFIGEVFNWHTHGLYADLPRDTVLSAYETMSPLAVKMSEAVDSPVVCPPAVAFIPAFIVEKNNLTEGQCVVGQADNLNDMLAVSDLTPCMDPYVAASSPIRGKIELEISFGRKKKSSATHPKFLA